MPNKLLTVQEAARILKVSEKTLRRWEEKKYITPIRTSGKHRRYSLELLKTVKRNINNLRRESYIKPNIIIIPEPEVKIVDQNNLVTNQVDSYSPIKSHAKNVFIGYFVFVILSIASYGLVRFKSNTSEYFRPTNSSGMSKVSNVAEQQVLAATSFQNAEFNINIPTVLNSGLTVNSDATFNSNLTIGDDTFNDITGTGLAVVGQTLSTTLGTDIVSAEIVDGSISEVDLLSSNTPAGAQFLTFNSTTGGFTWVNEPTDDVGTNYFTDGDNITYLTDTTDEDFAIGGSGTSAPFFFDVSSGNLAVDDLTVNSIALDAVGSNNVTSGASLVGVFDELSNSSSTNLQDVLDDLDSAIGGGGSKFTQDTGFIYLTSTTDSVTIGGATELGKLAVDGDSDQIQFLVQGNGTQTANLAVFENSAGTDLLTLTNAGNLTTTGNLVGNSNTTLGDTNSDTLTINAGTSGSGISFGDSSFANCTAIETVSGVLTCGSDAGSGAMTSFSLSGDSGSDQTISDTNILEVAGGANGIDTVAGATDTVTINLDTTEIGSVTFGSGSAITWTFDASGGTDPTITFGSGLVTVDNALTVTGTATTNGTLTANGSVTLGDNGDTVAVNSSDWDINATGDITGVGAITADGAISFTPGSTSDVTFAVDTDSLFLLDSTVTNGDNLVVSPNNAGTGSTFTGTLTSSNLTADRTWTLQDGDGTLAFLTDIPTSDNYQYWTIDGDDATTEQIGSTQTLLIAGGTNGVDTDVSATDTITLNLDTTEIGTTTFGSGSAITWTFDASGGTDPTITFGSDLVTIGNGLTVSGAFTANGTTVVGDGGDTVAINSSDWDIDATGAITGASFDANGSGNSITNIENADLANDTLDWDKFIDSSSLDADLTIAEGAGEEITINKAFTNNTAENGLVLNLTASDTGAATTTQYGVYIDNLDSTEGADSLITLNNSDADDAVGTAILFTAGGAGTDFTTGIDFSAANLTREIVLENGEAILGQSADTITFEDDDGTDYATLTASALTITGDLAVSGGNVTTAITFDSTVTITGTLTANGNIDFSDGGADTIEVGDTSDTLTIGSTGLNVASSGTITDGNSAVTIDDDLTITTGTTISAASITAFNCTDCIDFDDLDDTLELDSDTSIAFDASEALQINAAGTTETDGVIDVDVYSVSTSGSVEAASFFMGAVPTTSSTATYTAVSTYVSTDNNNLTTGSALFGIYAGAEYNGNGTVDNVSGIYIDSGSTYAGTGTITTSYGLNIAAAGDTGGTIGTTYGIRVGSQTVGATANYGIAIGTASGRTLWISNASNPTTPSGGIAFGSSQDTELFRSAANSLATNDNFYIDLAFSAGDTTPDGNAYNTIGTGDATGANVSDGSDLFITDSLEVDGTVYLDGTTDINASTTLTVAISGTDEVTLTGTNLSAATAEGNSLGSATLEWEQLFVGDDNGISFGLDQDWTLGYDEATDDRLELTTSGTTGALVQSATATGNLFNLIGNSISTGTILQTESTSTALTTAGDAFLGYFNWNPGGATTASGDLFRINIGSNGNVTNLFNVTNNGSSLFSVSESAVTSTLPLRVSDSGVAPVNQALVIFDQDEDQDILTASASGVPKFVLDNSGKVYLGALDIETANTTGTCWFNNTINGVTLKEITDCNGTPTDLAENFGTTDATIEAGDVVIADGQAEVVSPRGLLTSKAYVKKSDSTYNSKILGVVSTAPNQVYGEDGLFDPSENPRPISLAGRVPTKVSLENGPIKTGDSITSSSTPGVAMKATKAGQVIGKALQDFNPTNTSEIGKIIVLMNVGFEDPEPEDAITREEIESLLQVTNENQRLLEESRNWNINTATVSGTFSEVVTNDLFVTGIAALNSLSITDSIVVGNNLSITDGNIDSLSTLNFMAGKVSIDVDGNVTILGDLKVSGTLEANKVTVSNSVAGNALIPTGSQEIIIINENIKEDSLIFVTPTTATKNPIYVKNQTNGQATIGYNNVDTQVSTESGLLETEVRFNWWIVGIKE